MSEQETTEQWLAGVRQILPADQTASSQFYTSLNNEHLARLLDEAEQHAKNLEQQTVIYGERALIAKELAEQAQADLATANEARAKAEQSAGDWKAKHDLCDAAWRDMFNSEKRRAERAGQQQMEMLVEMDKETTKCEQAEAALATARRDLATLRAEFGSVVRALRDARPFVNAERNTLWERNYTDMGIRATAALRAADEALASPLAKAALREQSE